MRLSTRSWFLLSLLLFAAAALFWREGEKRRLVAPATKQKISLFPNATNILHQSAFTPVKTENASSSPQKTNSAFQYRLSNTTESLGQLVRNDKAILLMNALIDTSAQPIVVPEHLRSHGDPESYIVQSKGVINDAFRNNLKAVGAEIVSYVPNNAYLVRASAEAAKKLENLPGTQAVLPYEPYYKLSASLLDFAVNKKPLPEDVLLKVTIFSQDREAAAKAFESEPVERGPFGDIFVPKKNMNLIAMAQLPFVQNIEKFQRRTVVNDLSRVAVTVSSNTLTAFNYLGLTGSNVLVNINDTGVDATHPDLVNRVTADIAFTLTDTNGHGTHVAGTIASSGENSPVAGTNIDGSLPNANFRGKAPAAKLFAMPIDLITGPYISDQYLQETAAKTNAFISNNSWGYIFDNGYNSAAASYDQAVRDALPAVTGMQPLLYVFAAGNSGFGNNDGGGGQPESISAPGTAKNVITVGSSESLRNITQPLIFYFTNVVNGTNVITTNSSPFFLAYTDDPAQVSSFSSRGNVGIGVEGEFGRFKPDVIAPGAFIVSTRSKDWRLENDFPPSSIFSPYYETLSNLNERITGHLYRYETGTSMAAPSVSGVLALMQEFFEQKMRLTNSPALMKALLINGARSLGPQYDYQVNTFINFQGWGLVNLTNSIPEALTNSTPARWPAQFFDQSPTNALSTGQEFTQTINLSPDARNFPLRITLVWTDPPGNPVVSQKLVNDLDLIVTSTAVLTNIDDPTEIITNAYVYRGNNFPGGSDFTVESGTNNVRDFVNNVENVFLNPQGGPLEASYTIRVVARRVNVNAVTSHPNGIMQDFALVVSTENAALTAPFTLTNQVAFGGGIPNVRTMTNGVGVLNQRVGANAPLLDFSGNGSLSQWQFYIFTNTFVSYSISGTNGTNIQATNVAFATFFPPNLSGVNPLHEWPSRVDEADIDLYVSTNENLLFLDPVAIAGADKSTNRGGSEAIIYTNSVKDRVYYIGVKSEDQQAAEYGFFGIATDEAFSQEDANGNLIVRGVPSPVAIPDEGNAPKPKGIQIHGFVSTPVNNFRVRRVVVTNSITHELIGDLFGVLHFYGDGRPAQSVLNNHTLNNDRPSGTFNFIYDDSDQGDILPRPGNTNDVAGPTDFPGTLRNFMGKKVNAGSHFMLNMVDNTPLHLGTNNFLSIFVERQPTNSLGGFATILGNRWYYDFVDVPPDATNLQVIVTGLTGPIEAYLLKANFPTRSLYDKKALLNPPGGIMSLGLNDSPPLTPGLYIIGFFNPGATSVSLNYRIKLDYDLSPATLPTFTSTGITPLIDDAVTTSTLYVGQDRHIVDAQVGIRIDHPRVSDLSIRLVSPQGTKVLLAEDRGRITGQNYGVSTAPRTNSVIVVNSSFENEAPNKYAAPSVVDGWNVISSNVVNVINDLKVANDGNQYLAMNNSKIFRTLPTTVGKDYVLNYSYRRPDSSLINWWPGNNNTIDTIGGQNGTLMGGANYAAGKVSTAFNFDGINDFVDCGVNAGNFGTNEFTIDFWIKTVSTRHEAIITKRPHCGGASSMFDLRMGGVGVGPGKLALEAYSDSAGGNAMSMITAAPINDGNFHHVAFTRVGTTVRVYVDGSLSASISTAGITSINNSTSLWFGRSPCVGTDGTAYFTGQLDEVGFHKRGISASEIQSIYSAGSNGRCFSSNPPTNCLVTAQVMLGAGIFSTSHTIGNTNWITNSVSFVSPANGTSLTVEGIDSGMLLDSVVLKELQIDPGITYAVFTENTNYFPELIKFAQPPFGTNTNVVVNNTVFQSSFESSANGRYSINTTVDGWGVTRSNVYVCNETNFAHTGTNLLSLAEGAIGRTFPSQPGTIYNLSFAYRQADSSLINWWPGNSNTIDTIGGKNGTVVNGAGYAVGKVGAAFNFDGVNDSVNFGTSPGNFGTNDFTIDFWIKTSSTRFQEAVMGKRKACNGTSGWDIRIGGPGAGTGRLNFVVLQDLSGVNFNSIVSTRPVNDGVWHHIAARRRGPNIAMYLDGSLDTNYSALGTALITNSADLTFGTEACVGTDGTAFFTGQLDEVGFHNKAISTNEIYSLYLAGSSGRCSSINPPTNCVPSSAAVIFNNTTNIITGGPDWFTFSTKFTATSSGISSITNIGLQSGMWLDTFRLRQVAGGNYYLPEETLSVLAGENALGDWKLEVWDSRTGSVLNANLISWQLQFTFAPTNSNQVITLTNGISYTAKVDHGIKYFIVEVPFTAKFATNTLTSTGDLILLGDRSGLPTGNPSVDDYFVDIYGAGPGEYLLLSTVSPPSAPLQPGQRYYLGVQNYYPFETNMFTIQVDFDQIDPTNLPLSALSSGSTVTNSIASGPELDYFQFDVSPAAASATFELLNPSGDVNLVVKKGLPLPNSTSFDYESVNPGNSNEMILVLTNSGPVPLSPGRWYLGVYNFSSNVVTYSIRATEQLTGSTSIIDLMDGVAVPYGASPGPLLTNFFRFVIDQTNASALFELYNLSGNVDLIARRGALPSVTEFDFRSQNTGADGEQIVLQTNSLLTDLNGEWFFGVPNNETFDVNYTIRATVSTNGMLVSGRPPSFTSAPLVTTDGKLSMTWNSVTGQHYEVQASTDLIVWTTIDTVTATGGTATYTTTTPITSPLHRFYRIRQVP